MNKCHITDDVPNIIEARAGFNYAKLITTIYIVITITVQKYKINYNCTIYGTNCLFQVYSVLVLLNFDVLYMTDKDMTLDWFR